MTIDLTDYSPIADILVLEKRNCSRCHFGSYQPARIMRLWTSHTGPHRHALVARKPDETPLSIRGTRVVETLVEACMNCWHPTFTWEELKAIVPDRPADRPPPHNGTFAATADRKRAEALARASAPGVSREARARMAVLMAPKPTMTLAGLLQALENRP